MSDLACIMSNDDIHDLKKSIQEMHHFLDNTLYPFRNTLSNDWKKASDLLSKISADQRKVDMFAMQCEAFIKKIKSCLGEKDANGPKDNRQVAGEAAVR